MKKPQVVLFTSNNARILNNPPNLESFKGFPNAVINPNLSKVHGYPPHHWKLVKNEILPMNEQEMKDRNEDITDLGPDNEAYCIREIEKTVIPPPVVITKTEIPMKLVAAVTTAIVIIQVILHCI